MNAPSLTFWAALPFVLPQAVAVRRHAPPFTDAAGPREGTLPGPDPLRLLALGDSVIAGVGVDRLENGLPGQVARALARRHKRGVIWQALGRTGATSADMHHLLLPHLPRTSADLILLSAGVNDITRLTTLPAWQRSLNALLTALHAWSPQAQIGMVGVPPMQRFPLLPRPLRDVLGLRARHFAQAAQQVIARHPQVLYLSLPATTGADDFSADGYHPSAKACRAIAVALAQHWPLDNSGVAHLPVVDPVETGFEKSGTS